MAASSSEFEEELEEALDVAIKEGREDAVEKADKVNFWRRYRGELPLTPEQIRIRYQSRNFTRTPIAADPTLTGNLFQYQGGVPPPVRAVPNDTQQAWLDQAPRGLPGTRVHWVGTKFLKGSDNGSAKVGLWKYQPPAGVVSVKQNVKALVVKEDYVDGDARNYALTGESNAMRMLAPIQSPHVLRSPCSPVLYGDGPRPDAVCRIFLEYCPMGDLADLITLRRIPKRQFDVLTVWKFFECLVDGACVMHFGQELVPDADGKFEVPEEDMSLIHFDIKPQNIFLVKRDETHNTPVLKYGDFGNSRQYNSTNRQDQSNEWKTKREQWREGGTQLYFTPEQFSEEWDYADYASSPIAGKYTSDKTNIFGIGLLMYQVITLDTNPPTTLFDEPENVITPPFLPSYTLDGQPPQGNTYGPDIRAYKDTYGQRLTELITECLYENPNHRPTLQKLREEIAKACKTIREDDNINPEAWENFLPQPPVAPVAPTVLRATRKRNRGVPTIGDNPRNFYPAGTINMLCAGILDDGTQCTRTFRTVPTENPRCHICLRKGR